MNELEKQGMEAVRAFWELNSLRGTANLLKALDQVHPDFMGFGSTRIETYQDVEIFKRSVEAEFSENPDGFSFSFSWTKVKQLSDDLVLVCALMSMDVNTPIGILPINFFRFSCLLKKDGESMSIIHLHGSKPEELGVENELWPGAMKPRLYDNTSIIFTDMVGFTELSSRLSPELLVEELNEIFYHFDLIVARHDILKIKTIGDAYMAVSGLLNPDNNHAHAAVAASLEMYDYLKEKNSRSEINWEMRTGVHSGPVIGGLIGRTSRVFDVWGDSVNVASRMESSGVVGRINVSRATYDLLVGNEQYSFESRGVIQAKGKGEMEMYLVSRV